MTELWLVRHGQTDWNAAGRFQGQSDVPLNAIGLAQAETLAARLANTPFDALYSSDLSRAYRTAQYLAQTVGLPIRVEPRLREICQGEWEGMNYRQVVERFGEPGDPLQSNVSTDRAPGGETILEVAQRVSAAVKDIAASHPGQRVLVVSHGLALATLRVQALGLPLNCVYQHILPNTTPMVIKQADDGRWIEQTNLEIYF